MATEQITPKFVQFPNGKVWAVDENNRIAGSVYLDDNDGDSEGNLESWLDALSEAATGSTIGLNDFSYSEDGNGLVSFNGIASELPENEEDYPKEGYKVLPVGSRELQEALMTQYCLMPVEVDHAIDALGIQYGEEHVLLIHGTGRQIRTPAYPAECDYVRIVRDGLELAYWTSDEWRDAPMDVMGAIMGAASGPSQATS